MNQDNLTHMILFDDETAAAIFPAETRFKIKKVLAEDLLRKITDHIGDAATWAVERHSQDGDDVWMAISVDSEVDPGVYVHFNRYSGKGDWLMCSNAGEIHTNVKGETPGEMADEMMARIKEMFTWRHYFRQPGSQSAAA